MVLNDKTFFITGGSRGIGFEIAKRCAKDGANIAIAAKTDKPHPKLPGTIHTAADEIREAGGNPLPLVCDVRDPDQVQGAIDATVDAFGGIDILINNASAIMMTGTEETPIRKFDLMIGVNGRGTFLCTQRALPHLKKSDHGHVLMISPPLDMDPRWFKGHVAYTMAKFGMSMCVLGMAEEFRNYSIGVNALWPLTCIDTSAVRNLLGGDAMAKISRSPEIVADAAHVILSREPSTCTGNFFIDEEVLLEEGVSDFSEYQLPDTDELMADVFVPSASFSRTKTKLVRPF